MNFEATNLHPYDEHVQQQRRAYRDAQYDTALMGNLARRALASVSQLTASIFPNAARSRHEQQVFANALHAGLSKELERC